MLNSLDNNGSVVVTDATRWKRHKDNGTDPVYPHVCNSKMLVPNLLLFVFPMSPVHGRRLQAVGLVPGSLPWRGGGGGDGGRDFYKS